MKKSELRQLIKEILNEEKEDARHEGNVVSSADVAMKYPSGWDSSLMGSDDGSESISLTKGENYDKQILISVRDGQYIMTITDDATGKYKNVAAKKVKLSDDDKKDAKPFAVWIKQNLSKGIKAYDKL